MSLRKIRDEEDYVRQLTNAGSKLVVADFSAEWCRMCGLVTPLLELLSRKYESTAVFLKVDVDLCPGLTTSRNVNGMPTIIFYKNTAEIHRLMGTDTYTVEMKLHDFTSSRFPGSEHSLREEIEIQSTPNADSGPSVIKEIPVVDEAEVAAQKAMALNNNSPVTTIRVKLTDGSNLKLQININQYIFKIREYINIARPTLSSSRFSLWKSFPHLEIKNENKTIEEAKLSNSVLILKLKK